MSDWDFLNNSSNNNNSNNNSNGVTPYQAQNGKSKDGFSHLLEDNYFDSSPKNTATSNTSSPPNKQVDTSKFITHVLTPKDTLQGLSLKYNVKVSVVRAIIEYHINDLKRANNIWTQDSLFIKKTILIPVESTDSNSDNGSNGSGSGGNSLNSSSNNIRSMEGGNIGNSSRNNSANSFDNYFPDFEKMNKTFNSQAQKEKPVLPKSTFNKASNANTANDMNNNDLNYNFNIRPNSTLSFSPVVNSLDHKTQTQFSLLDDEFNPL
ncbi:hypothetical protein DICPUDRAFT_43563 [Dictyostelium purpureum]|uniref:LysM domain-containing protein n=1 Tax=Dictyostelium purpureum TaxID=5786 RepID=F1A4B0_DICPU|nr:uncharacterized protein DICPUDRAFT_43563 [Dictyostelium purpureum]EGC28965.1 hypothetical protein DICPUDRAFT_43563 [Dictyostelium purpureum]|eukprot:XP_003294504.1 hypothetical protein DICPUDRAFT_43563 [Dictyostelium purpureum]